MFADVQNALFFVSNFVYIEISYLVTVIEKRLHSYTQMDARGVYHGLPV